MSMIFYIYFSGDSNLTSLSLLIFQKKNLQLFSHNVVKQYIARKHDMIEANVSSPDEPLFACAS